MTKPVNPSSGKPAGDDRNLVPVDENYKALTFEDTMHQIWKRNRNLVWGLVGVVILVILAKGGWEYMQRQKELEVEKSYAAATNSDQLKAFAAAHGDHALAGVAYVRLADEAYTAGKSADAIANYDKALGAIKAGPLAARAKVGRALAKIQSGKNADGVADLKQIAADTNQLAPVRAEATYQLASLAAADGNAVDVKKYADDLMKIDPGSTWAQRGMMLVAMLPPAPAAAMSVPGSSSSAPAPKKEESKSEVQVKLPGK